MYEKWSKYKLGEIEWINKRRNHAHRSLFIESAMSMSSIVEIGPGELIEYAELRKLNPLLRYSIVDVSDLFISNCKKNFPEVNIIKSSIEELESYSYRHDLVYAASVLEHSRDVRSAIKNSINLADRFHFVMFKWSYDGNLESTYRKKKKYWSTSFNIHQILEAISKTGVIESLNLISPDGITEDFTNIPHVGDHRDGKYLIIRGRRI